MYQTKELTQQKRKIYKNLNRTGKKYANKNYQQQETLNLKQRYINGMENKFKHKYPNKIPFLRIFVFYYSILSNLLRANTLDHGTMHFRQLFIKTCKDAENSVH